MNSRSEINADELRRAAEARLKTQNPAISILSDPLQRELALRELEVEILRERLGVSPAAELAQNAGEARLRAMLIADRIPKALNNGRGTITFINPAFIQAFGYTLEEVADQQAWWPRVLPDPDYRKWVLETWKAELERARITGTPVVAMEVKMACKNGPVKTVLASAAMLENEFRGEYLVILQDITELKRTGEELKRSASLLQQLLDSSPDLIFFKDRELRTILCNNSLAATLGKEIKDIYGKNDIELGRDPELVKGNPAKGIRGFEADDREVLAGKTLHISAEPVNVGGKIYYFDTVKIPLRNEKNEIVGVIGTARNVTERKQAEDARGKIEARLMLAVKLARLGIWDWDIATDQTTWNDEMLSLYGITREQFTGKGQDYINFTRADYRTGQHEKIKNRFEKGITEAELLAGKRTEFLPRELCIVRPDGSECFTLGDAVAIVDENRKPLRMLGVTQDITEQRRVELELKLSQAKARAVFDQTFETVALLDLQGNVIDANRSALGFVGKTLAEISGKPFWELTHAPVLQDWLKTAIPQARDGKRIRQEVTHVSEANTTHYFDFSLTPVLDEKDKVLWLLAEGRDISDRKNAEIEKRHLQDQLYQAQKMEALGVLAGGIAHDFNNILVSILGYADLATHWNTDDHRTLNALTHIVKAGHRARDLVNQILTFSRREVAEYKPFELNQLAMEVEALLRSSLPPGIQLLVRCGSNPQNTRGDSSQIHQVILNLCTNAIHAMPQGGRLELSLERKRFQLGEDKPDPYLLNRAYHVLTVRDNGTGIDPAVLPRIFEPFFSTKGHAGTGLGLATVHGIITKHEGVITVESKIGVGTAFTIYLPEYDAAVSKNEATASAPSLHARRVLLMDDELPVLELTREMLVSMGLVVSAYSNPAQGLKALAENPGAFDLILTDLNMPEVDGIQVCREARQLAPDVPVGIFSALVDDQSRDKLKAEGARFIFMKPFTTFELAQELAALNTQVP